MNTENESVTDDLEQIFSALRHEFGNTVNSLKMTIDILIRNYHDFDEKARLEFLHRAQDQVERQHRFLDAMRKYARATVRELEEIPLITFWNDCVVLLRQRLEDKHIRFSHHIQSDPCHIIANSLAVQHILEHLVENAEEAISNVAFPEIELAACKQATYMIVQIQDNGPGIHADIRDRVFMPFFTTHNGHAGLGLSICRKLLNQMGGRLELNNRQPFGVDACIWLRTL